MLQTVIIGAGVMGLSIARQLETTHRNVQIIDRSTPRMNASYAAGGMLGAQNEFFEDTSLYRLAMKSREMMPETAQALQRETGMDIEYQKYGLIKVASNLKDIPTLEKQLAFLQSHDHSIKALSSSEMTKRFPHLDLDQSAAFKIQDDGQINANIYTQALIQSVLKRPSVSLMTHTETYGILKENEGYTVQTSKGDIKADELIIAAGAWSGALLNHLDIQLPTHPVKGDVKLIASDYNGLKETIFNVNGCYIVPKKPNRFLIGATSEFDNWSTENNDDNIKWLDRESQRMIPELAHSHTIKSWTGIRPITPDEVPIMGTVRPNLYVTTGHYRNGILLSPIVGELMAKLIDGDTKAHATLAPFTP
ncbi:glycine oxidase ThiO [Staphylococcus canis]|uniref:glycine oxidase n=1 Tax=Staphylococcus canis TaxID=2724942 RepID=A0ABS0TBB0_9STAP|nr:glycine oxidase ThiO [Staphylococcus canis]MBI5975043.1 glycine oxidase ThiO [Staphylococcus canis]